MGDIVNYVGELDHSKGKFFYVNILFSNGYFENSTGRYCQDLFTAKTCSRFFIQKIVIVQRKCNKYPAYV